MYFHSGTWRTKVSIESASKIEEVIKATGSFSIVQTKPISQFVISNPSVFTTIYEIYIHPVAKKLVSDKNWLKASDLPMATLRMTYDYRPEPATVQIIIGEIDLAKLEYVFYGCDGRHKPSERLIPPLKDGFKLYCKHCGKELRKIQEPLLANLRHLLISSPKVAPNGRIEEIELG